MAFILPLVLDSVEGSEAALLVAASAVRGTWKRAAIAAVAAGVTLIPIGIGLYFLFQFVNGNFIDYAIAVVVFLLGANELREGLTSRGKKEDETKNKTAKGWKAVWPAYFGSILEGSEALLYTFAVAHGSGSWLSAAVGGGIGFALPWIGLKPLKRLVDKTPEWKVELSIGIVIMSAAAVFGILHVSGIISG